MTPALRPLVLPLLVLVAINLIPQVYLRPLWSTALCAVFLGYRVVIALNQLRMPPRWTIFLAQLVVGVSIWQHYHSIFGDEAAGTLLTLLTCLKTFELRTKRDFFVTSMLCFMVLMSNLLLDQSLLLSLFVMIDVILIMSYLYALESEKWENKREHLRATFWLTFKSLPLLLVCFVLFPRFTTGFGSGDQTTGKTGITDQLRPGSVSQLVQSDELVFRANFLKSETPPKRNLYWRGAILDQADGLNWSRQKSTDRRPPPPPLTDDEEVEIYLEPGFEKFIFSLEATRTVEIPSDFNRRRIQLQAGQIFELSGSLQNRERYVLRNNPDGGRPIEPLESGDRYLAVASPPSARLARLLQKLKGSRPAETVANILQLFRTDKFEYSMQPPAAPSLDHFIFQSKSGFCEHYAASTASLLRHLNIPSRVVVGFQGGSSSFLEKYISVRGVDAHAWVEYLDNDRWRRVDPTAQVAPARLTLGGESYLPEHAGWLSAYRRIRAVVDEAEASWIGFLIGFDLARQKELLARFGMEETLSRALPVFLILALILVIAVLYFLEAQGREKISREARLYQQLVKILKKWQVPVAPSDGPLTLMLKTRAVSLSLAGQVAPLLDTLTLVRFAGQPLDDQRYQLLARGLRRLPRRKPSIK